MLAKTVQRDGRDWDVKLPYVLFAYRASCQESTQESPFFMLYGRDPKLPTPALLNPTKTRSMLNLKEYGIELHARMSEAWELARQNVTRAQKRQKATYDRRCRPVRFQEGERVFLFMPAEKTGQARKFARPFHGPYRIVELESNTAKVRRVDRPGEEPILVALDRLRSCPEEVADEYWPPSKGRGTAKKKAATRTSTITPATDGTASPVSVEGDPGMDGDGGPETHVSRSTEATVQPDPPSWPANDSAEVEREPAGESTPPGKWKGRLRCHRDRPRFLSEDGHI